jgi:molybdenum cofactor biosynthesis enzyme MoaA
MAEDMQFAPKSEVLSLEELAQVAEAFVASACARSASPAASR